MDATALQVSSVIGMVMAGGSRRSRGIAGLIRDGSRNGGVTRRGVRGNRRSAGMDGICKCPQGCNGAVLVVAEVVWFRDGDTFARAAA